MIKQNIKIAIVTIICFITFWLILFNFIKIDRTTQGVITFNESIPMISIEAEDAAYIYNHEINSIQVEFSKQYFDCHITYLTSTKDYSSYVIVLPKEIYQTQEYTVTNVIVTSQNLYQYWFKK